MTLGDDFRKLATSHIENSRRVTERRKLLGSRWEDAKRFLKGIGDEIKEAAGEFAQFSVAFDCVNGHCTLSISAQPSPSTSHELKFRLDLDREKIVVTDTTGSPEHAFDLDPFDDQAQDALEERVSLFQAAFFKILGERKRD